MSGRLSKSVLIAVLVAALCPGAAFAGDGKGDGVGAGELRYDWKLDMAVTAIAATGWITMTATKGQIGPTECRWSEVDAFDRWGHDHIKWSSPNVANKMAYVTGYALAPMAAFGLDALAAGMDDRLSGFWVDALLIAEATALSSFTTEMVKIAVGRQRPRAHYGRGSQNTDDNMSFYSGHTSLAFSLAVASGTVASMREYRYAPLVWGAGLGVAAVSGYLSLAADRHYLTDVIAGAAMGSAFGFAIPYLFHRPREEKKTPASFSVAPVEGGGLLTVSGLW